MNATIRRFRSDPAARTPRSRRQRRALAALVAWGSLVLPCAGQGVVRKEENTYRHLLQRRLELAEAWPGLDAAQREQVCADLVAEDHGVPFRPVLQALARLRGREVDAAWMARGTLGVFALPEVVDPEAANPFCRDLHATVYLPYRLDGLGEKDLELEVVVTAEATGDEVFRGTIDEEVGVDELLRYQGRVTVPGAGLDDGAYRLTVRATVAGVEPRPGDPELEARFAVSRGFQVRSEALLGSAGEGMVGRDRALWSGLAMPVSRTYFGREGTPLDRPVAALDRAEVAMAARVAGDDPLAAMEGWVPVGVPGTESQGDEAQPPIQLRLRAPLGEAGDATPVLLVAGAPIYTPRGRRPSGPRTTDPGWTAHVVAGIEALDGPVAVLESSGRTASAAADLEATLAFLAEVWGDRPVVLVAEREAAVVSCLALGRVRERLRGLVLIGAGSVFRERLGDFAGLPVRMIGEHGTPAARNLEGTRRLLRGEFGAVPDGLRFEIEERSLPFGIGLWTFLPELRAWIDGL